MKLSTKISFIVVATISLIIVAIFSILIKRYDQMIQQDLLQTARSFYKSIVITRSWVAKHEGVYVKKLPGVHSNPYLKNPDIVTKDNQVLTLKNPAVVTRELSELSREMGGNFQFHITSLNPVNPHNSPNQFERQALESFQQDSSKSSYLEYYRTEKINLKRYFRYFGPLFTEPSCINCHSVHGYKVGDIRGGISIILPMDSIERAMHRNFVFMVISALMTIFVLSLIINYLLRRVVVKPLHKIENAAKALEQGKYEPVHVETSDEIGDLANAFQSMQRKIQLYTKDLQQSEKKYRTLLNCSLEAVLIVDKHGKIIEANHNISKLAQYEIDEILNRPVGNLIDRQSIRKYRTNDQNQDRFEATIRRKDGSKKPIEVYISPEYFTIGDETNLRLYYLRDITERKNMEKIMIETEKMYALNQLSSGIAHEIRNPLFSVRNNLNFLKEKFNHDTEFSDVYLEIDTGIKRINTLVNSILDYARPHKPEFKKSSLKTIIENSLKLVRRQFEKANHEIVLDIPENLPLIELDPHKMEQVFINLCTNSLNAMKDNGKFEISARMHKKQVKITVSDNGCGINKDDIHRIFDPFFTRNANGTGLGLSIVKNIVQQHNGEIRVRSEENLGATFEIVLPIDQN